MNHNLVAISTSWGTLTIISSTASKASLPRNCIRNVQFVLSENKSESQILNCWNKCSINSDLWSPKWSSQTHRAYTHFSRSRNIYLYLLIQTHVLVRCQDGDGACTTRPIYSLTYVLVPCQKGGDTCTCTNSRPMWIINPSLFSLHSPTHVLLVRCQDGGVLIWSDGRMQMIHIVASY